MFQKQQITLFSKKYFELYFLLRKYFTQLTNFRQLDAMLKLLLGLWLFAACAVQAVVLDCNTLYYVATNDLFLCLRTAFSAFYSWRGRLRLLLATSLLFLMPLHVFAAPTNITGITINSTPANATTGYVAGNIVTARVAFSGNETVTGTPTLTLNIGGTLRTATYTSGSGTTALIFSYTVVAADADTNGISVNANSLALNGGTITNGGTAATLTHAAVADDPADKVNVPPDTTAPVFRSAAGAGSTITLFYDELGSGLNAAIVPAVGNFTFSRNGGVGPQLSVTSVTINPTAQTVSLNLNGLIAVTDTNLRISYTPGTNKLQDAAGNLAAALSNVYIPVTMPTFNINASPLKFNTPTLLSGTGLAAGSKILFSNVITVDGQSIDAIVTIPALAGLPLTGTDTVAGAPAPALKDWFTLAAAATTAAGGTIQIDFEFIKSGSYGTTPTSSTGADVILENVAINAYDLDAGAQFQDFGGYATYALATNTSLVQTQFPGYTHFQTTNTGNVTTAPGTSTGDQLRVLALYDSIHTISLKTGNATNSPINYLYIEFGVGPSWASGLPPTYQVPTVNKKTTNDTTPDLTGTFVGTVTNSTNTAWQFSIVVNGVTYTANTRTVVGNTVTLTNAATGLTAVFDATTGIGTWSLTIPAANALPLATYDVKATVFYGSSLANATAAGAKSTTDTTTNELIINNVVPDTTAPTLTKIERLNPLGEFITPAALAIQNYVDFNVTFSEAVTNVDKTDFQITGLGSTGATLSSVSQTGPTTYTVRISSIPTTNLGILDLNLLSSNDLVDLAGNLLDQTTTPTTGEGVEPTTHIDETYTIATIEYDYGDAPSGVTVDTVARSYGSASHVRPTSPTIYLGTTLPDIDTAANQTTWQGQTTATGDDAGGDEGIAQLLSGAPAVFPVLSAGDANYSLTLVCSGNGATVAGWIDFDKNGAFDAGEKKSGTCTANAVTLSWTTLTGLKTGITFARFRIASNAAESGTVTGAAADGEVEDYTLTIRPAVKIIKTLAPTTDTGKFNLTVSGGNSVGGTNPANNIANNGTTNFVAVDAAGTITVQETAGTATNLSNYTTALSCKLGDGTTAVTLTASDLTNSTTRSGTFTAPALNSTGTAAQVVCIFTNTKAATVKLQKTTLGGFGGPFTFAQTNLASAPANISTTAVNTAAPAAPAAINVTAVGTDVTLTETVASGYTLTSASCSDANSAVTGNPASFGTLAGNVLTILATNVKAGADISCSFTNTKAATVKVQKTTLGGFGGPFTFAQTNLASAPANISTTAVNTAAPAAPVAINVTAVGTDVTLTETVASGYTLTSASCSDANSAVTGNPASFGTLAGNVLTILATNVKAGADISCSFTNSKAATVSVNKISNGGVGSFSFTGSNGLPVTATTITTSTAGVSATTAALTNVALTALNTATTITEATPPAGYTLSGASCTGLQSGDTATLVGSTLTIPSTSVIAGAAINCTFTNTKAATVTVTKISNGGTGTFTFTGTNGWSSQNITTTTSGVGVTGVTQTLTAAGVSTDITESGPPLGYILTGISCTGLGSGGTATTNLATRTVTLNAAATAAGSAITCTFTNAKTATVKVQKITQGGFDGPFSFAQTNLASTPGSITTIAANTPTPALPTAINVITSGTAVTLTETAAFGYTLTSASCTDANSLVTGNTGSFGSLLGNVLTISSTNVISGADISCIFTNTKNVTSTITGNVFKDSGTTGGTANNGIRDGAETGIYGVTVKLTDCSGTTYSTAITDGAGNYSLAASSAPPGTVCVEESNLSSYTSTGSNVAGSTSPIGYTLVTADKISFILVASTSYTGLNFGDVPANQFITDGAKTGIAGSTLIYPHTFIAGTGGSVTFSLPGATASPVIPDWNERLYIDTDCNALLDGSESSSVLLPVAMTVVEGQTICLIQKEFIPAGAPQGASNHVPVQALFAYTGSVTIPNATYTRQDITTVSSNALALLKEVSNVTVPTIPVWKTSNTAKSGEILEYRITYTNNSAEVIKNLQINDATPSFTTFVSGLCEPPVAATPASLGSCTLTKTLTPNNTGGLKWTFIATGPVPTPQLQPGASGFVTYRVKVD